MSTAYNKVIQLWTSTETPSELLPIEDWVIDPQFIDFERCQLLGPKYWVYEADGITIRSMTDQEINASLDFVIEARRQKRETINDFRNQKIYGGFEHNNITWGTSPTDIQNLNAVCTLIAVGAITSDVTWRDANNINHLLTPTDIVTLAATLGTFVGTCYQVSWTHKANIDALTTMNEIITYDFSQGWP